ncbi:hypothetical protein Aperf_G00000101829 [Anoplocephala perfoliata]
MSGMDSSSSSGEMDHSMYSMKMYFNTDLPFYLLFGAWYIDTVGKLVGACVGIFLLALMYEALKALRDRFLVRHLSSFQMFTRANTAIHDDSSGPSASGAGDVINYESPVVPLVQRHDFACRNYCSLGHILQTILHGVQLFISYLLMLSFMTFNVYICVALLLGSCLGYFLFFRRRFIVMGEQECCH